MRKGSLASILGLVALSLLIFFWRLDSPGLFEPNEGMYAEISREMLVLKDWITPHFNYVRYFEKPPLLYWVTALSYLIFGISEFAARFPIALAALGGVIVTYLIGKEAWGERAGLLSGLVLATSFGYFVFARIILTDLVFSFFLETTFLFYLRGYLRNQHKRLYYLLFYLGMALAVLTKGLIGLAFPFLTIGAFILITREFKLIREMELLKGIPLFFLVSAPWHILVALRNEGFLWFYFVNEHLLRFINKRHLIDYAPLPVYLFIAMVAVWLFPWSSFLPLAIAKCLPERWRPTKREERAPLFVLLWIGAVLLFFSFSPSRLEYYSIPAFPPLALCVGKLWADFISQDQAYPSRRAMLYTMLFLLGVAVLLLPAAMNFGKLERVSFYNLFQAFDAYSRDIHEGILSNTGSFTLPSYTALLPSLIWGSIIFLSGTGIALLTFLRKQPKLAFALLIATMIPVFYFLQQGIAIFEPHRSIKNLAMVVVRQWKPGEAIVTEGPYENFSSLGFYTRQRIYVLNGRFGDLEFGSHFKDSAPFFLDEEGFLRLWVSGPRIYLLTDSASRYEKLKQSRSPYILARGKNKWLISNTIH